MPYEKTVPDITLPATGGRHATIREETGGTITIAYKAIDTIQNVHEAPAFALAAVIARWDAAIATPGGDPPFDALVTAYPGLDPTDACTAVATAIRAHGDEEAGFTLVP